VKICKEEGLGEHIRESRYVKILPNKEFLPTIHCIPISASDSLLYALDFHDFLPDGLTIVRMGDIGEIQYDKACVFFESVVKAEGAMDIVRSAPKIELADWRTALSHVAGTGAIVVVDVGKEGCVNVGVILEAADSGLVMRCFSPDGVWDDDVWNEAYDDITGVKFNSRYTEAYARHFARAGEGRPKTAE
jgi:hypothetical protein